MTKGIVGSNKERKIIIKEQTPWTKTEISILAYFVKNNNKSSTYRDIARAYMSSSYSNYQKGCESLAKRGRLEKQKDDSFKVPEHSWEQLKKGIESTERRLPHFDLFLKKVKRVKRGK